MSHANYSSPCTNQCAYTHQIGPYCSFCGRYSSSMDKRKSNDELIKELQSENEKLKERLKIWEPKEPPPKGQRGFHEATKKGKRK